MMNVSSNALFVRNELAMYVYSRGFSSKGDLLRMFQAGNTNNFKRMKHVWVVFIQMKLAILIETCAEEIVQWNISLSGISEWFWDMCLMSDVSIDHSSRWKRVLWGTWMNYRNVELCIFFMRGVWMLDANEC